MPAAMVFERRGLRGVRAGGGVPLRCPCAGAGLNADICGLPSAPPSERRRRTPAALSCWSLWVSLAEEVVAARSGRCRSMRCSRAGRACAHPRAAPRRTRHLRRQGGRSSAAGGRCSRATWWPSWGMTGRRSRKRWARWATMARSEGERLWQTRGRAWTRCRASSGRPSLQRTRRPSLSGGGHGAPRTRWAW